MTASPEPDARVDAPRSGRLVRAILIALLISLSLASVVGLLALLMGPVGEDEGKLLSSTFVVALFSATGLASAARFDRGLVAWVPLGWLGIGASGISIALSVFAIWSEPSNEGFFRAFATVVLSAVILAYASLFLLARPRATAVTVLARITLVGLGLLWILAAILIWVEIQDFEVVGKLLGILGIVTVFGSLASPILNRLLAR